VGTELIDLTTSFSGLRGKNIFIVQKDTFRKELK
jgi:hypothetical protein